jgi:hypothetical protein
MIPLLASFDFSEVTPIVSFFSSLAIILGSIFVVFQIRDNKKLILAANAQARAAATQANLQTEQMKQTNEIRDMDLIMRLYEFANTAEVQSAWLTVTNTRITSYADFEKLPKPEQVSFYQIAALFESLGVLVERGIVKLEVVGDMFLTELAWTKMKPFLTGVREKYGDNESYIFFEKLNNRLSTESKSP